MARRPSKIGRSKDSCLGFASCRSLGFPSGDWELAGTSGDTRWRGGLESGVTLDLAPCVFSEPCPGCGFVFKLFTK